MLVHRDERASVWIHDEARERSACCSLPPERVPLVLLQNRWALGKAVPRWLHGMTLGSWNVRFCQDEADVRQLMSLCPCKPMLQTTQ